MKNPDENPLLKELLSGEEMSRLRRETLDRSLQAMRQGRARRRAVMTGAMAIVPLLFLVLVWTRANPSPKSAGHPEIQRVAKAEVPPDAQNEAKVETISDDELFQLFAGRPVALIGSPGRQEFVVLDERENP